MKHTGSTLLILLFIGLAFFVLPHSLQLRFLPKKASAQTEKQKITPAVMTPTPGTSLRSTLSTPITSLTQATPTSIPSNSPMPTSAPSGLDAIQSYLLGQINDYRKSQGLSEVSPQAVVCSFAATRAQEIVSNFSHDGFTSRVQNKTLPYPSYSSAVENIAMNSSYQAVVSSWINSSQHAENLRADTPYGCIGYSGNYYAYEGWRP